MSNPRLRIDTTDNDGVQYESSILQRRTEDGSTKIVFGRGRLELRSGSGYIDVPTATAHDLNYDGQGELQTADGELPYNAERETRELVLQRDHADIDYTETELLVILEIPEKLVNRK